MIPQSFDPLMDLGTAKDKGNPDPLVTPSDNAGGATAQPFNGAANFGTSGADIVFPGSNPVSTSDTVHCPVDVDCFDGSGGLAGMPMMRDMPMDADPMMSGKGM